MLEQASVVESATSNNLHRATECRASWWTRWPGPFAPVVLFAAAFATYAPALRNGFVWDDEALILRDPLIRSWRLIGEGFQHFLFTDTCASDFYRPLQRLSYTLDYALFFTSPFGYHLASILWHAGAAIALFYFAKELLSIAEVERVHRVRIAFVAALIWVLHPVQSAAVVYVSGRADSLAAAFGFVALFLLLRMLRASGNLKWLLGIGAGTCFLASALSKEIGLIFLLVGLVLVFAQVGRGALSGMLGLTTAVVVAYAGLRWPAEHLPPPPAGPMPALERPIVAARAVAEYTGLLALPWHLHMDREIATYPFGFAPASLDAASWRELQTLLGLILIGAAAWILWRVRGRKAIFLPLLFSLVCYLPVSGILLLNATVAEHWLYLPSAFLFLALVSAVDSLGSKMLWAAFALWLLFLPLRTFARTFDWRDQRTFLTRTISAGGDSARMLINLGGLELSEGDLDSARQALEKALAKEPGNPLARLNLAAVKMKAGDLAGARLLLSQITEPPELRARAEESLAVLENRESGTVDLMRLRLAARLGPPNWMIEQRYIKTLAEVGYPDRAITELKTCLVVAPYRSESWLMMSELLRRINRPNESAIALAQAQATDVHLRDRRTAP